MNPNLEVFVGGIPYAWCDNDLAALFPNCVKAEVSMVTKPSRAVLSRGFGFVTFRSKEEVEIALEMNGAEFCDRIISVRSYDEKRINQQKRV